MLRGLLLLAICCSPLCAQFNEMVTSDDGNILLFRSPWRLAGSNDTMQPKIFRWDAKGFSLVYSAPDPGFVNPPYVFGATMSGDARLSAYVVYPGCSGASCSARPPSLVLNGATAPPALTKFPPFQISRSGRYLSSGSTVVDLTSGQAQTAPGGLTWGGRFGIGNNGSLLMLTLHQAFILSTVDLTLSSRPNVVIATGQAVAAAVLSPSENRVVYEIGRSLWSYDVAAGQSTKLSDVENGAPVAVSQFQPSISNDGSRVLYRRFHADSRNWDAVVHDFATATTTVLARILPGTENLVISGDGKSAWLHREDGRLVRISIDSLQATEIAGRHAWIEQQDGAPVYGSYHRLYGGGFAADDSSPSLDNLSVDLSGLPFPIVSAGTRELDVQIPWDAPIAGQFPLTLHNSASPFESVLPLDLGRVSPTFERTGTPSDTLRSIQVFHQDFRGPLTPSDPALPGEYLHAYMTGLGDVQPRPSTGAPAVGLSYATRPLCWLEAPLVAQELAPVAFAGLAPGTIGMYQVDIGIPADFPPPLATLSCTNQPSGGTLSGDSGTIFIGKR